MQRTRLVQQAAPAPAAVGASVCADWQAQAAATSSSDGAADVARPSRMLSKVCAASAYTNCTNTSTSTADSAPRAFRVSRVHPSLFHLPFPPLCPITQLPPIPPPAHKYVSVCLSVCYQPAELPNINSGWVVAVGNGDIDVPEHWRATI